ncbi:DUF3667 domain-containing protein [Chitinophaga nivalis]|uniref:DUF3667 domain-containing protein n=1 Tax=Chitinophaga nivalis TaxID=2991709 RepID=A0ABT3IMJ3_9BACT|nr:DUF3667 domain-containing protein [Chitinophaga nivalis]MCW3465122.1 DUF3667 domain-containing protein [Chitinophaga nivalis]MCW3485186.1 DUF3667 domain-containing protein [Chitinophaga nivalis]
MNCKSCNAAVADKYCGHCGNPIALKRVDSHYIIHEVQHVLHFEKGILYTIKELLIRPGVNIRRFLTEDRSRLVKPVIFLIICSLLYTLITHFFHIEKDHYVSESIRYETFAALTTWIEGHYGYANIIMGLFIGAWLKLFMRKSAYNYYEVLIMLCFVIGTGMLIYALFALVQGISGKNMKLVSEVVSLLYSMWAIGQILGGRKIKGYVLSLVGYILGMGSFWLAVELLAWIIDRFK